MSLLQRKVNAHALKAVSREVVRPGGEKVPQKVHAPIENLMITVGATTYPVFILGQNDIDSTTPEYYIP